MIKEFDNIAIMSGDRNITYKQLLDYINLFAEQTPKDEAQPRTAENLSKTIIFSENREGWLYAFYSVWQNRGIAVPVDASSMVDDVAYILRDCQPSVIWTSREKLPVIEDALKVTGQSVKVLVIDDFETVTPHPRGRKTEIEDGNIFVKDNHDPALIIYTSGTTGSPKGVVLSYANLYANMYSVTYDVPIFNSERRTIILLPLHHILPLVGTVILPILGGGGVAICPSMSGPDIMDTLTRGKIAIFVGVPRLWQTLFNGIKKKIDERAATRMMFNLCAKVGSKSLSRKVFDAVHQKMGGHLAYCVSGGASLDKEIGEGLRTLGITMLEGYGMSETAPIISFTRPGDVIPGCVGLPMSTVTVKIVNDEICVKGPNVMLGYYNRPEETAQVIDSEGFVHTGDLGFIDELGRIHITGRSKEIIVLSNGKNVQPNEIEYKIEKYDDKVKEVAVTQNGDLLCAIIVPQDEWARNMTDTEIEEALKRQVIEPYNSSVVNYKKIKSIFVYHGELPRTKLDKLQRFKLKDLMLNSESKKMQNAECRMQNDSPTNNNAQPNSASSIQNSAFSNEYALLKQYIEKEKKMEINPTDNLETDLAFDSLDCVSLQGFVEQTFGIEIKADAFMKFKNVQAIADHIAKLSDGSEISEVEDINWHSILAGDSSNLELPSGSLVTTSETLFKSFLKVHNRLEIKGKENIPTNGNYIIAPNHQSFMDGQISVAGLDNNALRSTYYYATENHVRGSVVLYFANRLNIVRMERSNLKNSILKLGEVLKRGKNIVIFPEGRRTDDGKVGEFKKTFAILSKELQVPILPVRISGGFEAMPRGSKFPNTHKITVEYLKPVMPSSDETYDEISEKVREAIVKG
ncbi:MAG: AMP-binding protein [Bacteroidaceae bacterium]|nr:AMP-binding protein [Bacteroidaceae bacterium]